MAYCPKCKGNLDAFLRNRRNNDLINKSSEVVVVGGNNPFENSNNCPHCGFLFDYGTLQAMTVMGDGACDLLKYCKHCDKIVMPKAGWNAPKCPHCKNKLISNSNRSNSGWPQEDKLLFGCGLVIVIVIAAIALIVFFIDFGWKNAKSENTISAYQRYIQDYPDGEYRQEANKRIRALKEKKLYESYTPAVDLTNLYKGTTDDLKKKINKIPRDKIKRIILSELQRSSFKHLYVNPKIPPEKLKITRKSFRIPSREKALGFINGKVFGSENHALLFTEWGIYFRTDGRPKETSDFLRYSLFPTTKFKKSYSGIIFGCERSLGITDTKNKDFILDLLERIRKAIFVSVNKENTVSKIKTKIETDPETKKRRKNQIKKSDDELIIYDF